MRAPRSRLGSRQFQTQFSKRSNSRAVTRDAKSLLNLTSTLPRSRITVVDYAGSVGVRFRGPLRTRKRWMARILYGLTFPDYEPVMRGANWVFSELSLTYDTVPRAKGRRTVVTVRFLRGWKCSWLGCRRADLSHLRTSAPVASREINWPRRLRTRRATRGTEPRRARDDRQSTSRPHVLHELDAE